MVKEDSNEGVVIFETQAAKWDTPVSFLPLARSAEVGNCFRQAVKI